MSLKTVNIKKQLVTWGPIIFTGFAKDTIDIEVPDDSWAVETGADGMVTRVNKSVDHVKITVTLGQASETNDKLSAIWNADKITGAGIFPFAFRDGSGRSVTLAPQAFILKPPNLTNGNSAKDRTWVFMTGDASIFHGGN